MKVHVINGRFQPFHIGHLQYARAAAEGCDTLLVGLTQVPGLDRPSAEVSSARHRLERRGNPLSFAERSLIVQATLDHDEQIECEVAVTPFPIERPDVLVQFVPRSWTVVTTLHEEWNHEKVRILTQLGYSVTVVCDGEEKLARGSDIRTMLRSGEDQWRRLVPTTTASVLDKLSVPVRLREERD